MSLKPIFVFVLLLAGCRGTPNYRTMQVGPIVLHASLEEGHAIYNLVEIPLGDSEVAKKFKAQLPNGDAITLADLNINQLRNLSYGATNYDQLDYPSQYPSGTVLLYVGGYSFWTQNDSLAKMEASTVTLDSTIRLKNLPGGWEKNVPRLGRVGEEKMYPLPLSQADAEALFGKPDVVHDEWHM